ncbi:hypothetical protein, partial [Streptomyces yanii]
MGLSTRQTLSTLTDRSNLTVRSGASRSSEHLLLVLVDKANAAYCREKAYLERVLDTFELR